ncbi:hypothetical protein GCM10023205_61030 [Yinghuangia aomiensis]|uniref:Uncharacterized protein n=1 Tax=Yinghuangia aomiensis TaxID=676205 RepID=A0ABP9HZ76_9ACTN
MDLHEDYRALYQGCLSACAHIGAGRRVGVLGTFLAEQVREDLARGEHAIDSADKLSDVADDFAGLARTVADYDHLCREVFSDLHHLYRPEPPWRVLARGRTAVRATLQVRRRQPVFALHVAGDAWMFRVFPNPYDDERALVVDGTVSGDRHSRRTAQAPWERVPPEWCDQLDYGFQALGVKVDLPYRTGEELVQLSDEPGSAPNTII